MEHTRWVIRCKIYKSLNYIAVDNNRICTWWIHAYYDNSFARKNRVIVKLLLNVHSYLDQICPCCQLNTVNNVVHILFVCQCNIEMREILWKKVEECSPVEMVINMKNMNFEDRTKFVLNAFYSSFIHEWKDIYDNLSNYVYCMYTSYIQTKNETVLV